jgi:hypothetical protein
MLQQHSYRSTRQPFSQGTNDASRDKDVLGQRAILPVFIKQGSELRSNLTIVSLYGDGHNTLIESDSVNRLQHAFPERSEHMTGKDAIKTALSGTQQLMGWYLGDLTDADIVERPVPSANHIAWQLGHLTASEVMLVKEELPDAAYPALPAGFAEKHTKETSTVNPPRNFCSKAEYLDLFNKVRSATLATVEKLTEAELDRPAIGRMAQFAPRLGDVLLLVSNHTLMHAGQFTVVRRKLGKRILF